LRKAFTACVPEYRIRRPADHDRPEPMIKMVWMSVRLGMGAHLMYKPVEQ